MGVDLQTAALGLAAQGVAVFPCGPDKSPRTPNGFKDATTDTTTIEAWTWDAMIGAAIPDGQVVIDIDPRNGGDRTMEALRAAGKSLVLTRTVVTGGGGLHHYYTVPDGIELRSTLGPGVDVKKAGKGYVIVPPSPGYKHSVTAAPTPAPDWLIEELRVEAKVSAGSPSEPRFAAFEEGTPYGLAALERQIGRLVMAPAGGRNNALNRAAFSLAQLVAGGELDENRAKDDLVLASERLGLTPGEAAATLASGWRAGEQEPWQALPREALDTLKAPQPADTQPMWLDWDIEEEEPPFLCHPVLPADAYVLVYGATEASKSMAWLGLLADGSRQGYRSSIYSLENPAQADRSRLRRWAPDPTNLRLTNNPLDLYDGLQVDRLIAREKDWGDGRGADVILIDTYSHAFGSRSDDGNAKAVEFARRVRHVMREVGCTVIVIDHTGFQGDEPRDASAKRQQVDVAILMAKSGEWRPGEPSRFTMHNRKSARFANPFHIRGEIRDVGSGLALEWSGDAPRWEQR